MYVHVSYQVKAQSQGAGNHKAAVSCCHVGIGMETLRAKLESFLWMSGVTHPWFQTLEWSNGLFGMMEKREVSLIADRRRVKPLKSNKHPVKTKQAEAGLFSKCTILYYVLFSFFFFFTLVQLNSAEHNQDTGLKSTRKVMLYFSHVLKHRIFPHRTK